MIKEKISFVKNQRYRDVVGSYIVISAIISCICLVAAYGVYRYILNSDYTRLKKYVDELILKGMPSRTIYDFNCENDSICLIPEYKKGKSNYYSYFSQSIEDIIFEDNNTRYSLNRNGAFHIWSLKKTDSAKDEYEYTAITAEGIGYKTNGPLYNFQYNEEKPSTLYREALDYYFKEEFANEEKGDGYPITLVCPKPIGTSILDTHFSMNYYSLTDRFGYNGKDYSSGVIGVRHYGNDYWRVYLKETRLSLKIDLVNHSLEASFKKLLYFLIPFLLILFGLLFIFFTRRIKNKDLYWKKWICESKDSGLIFEYSWLSSPTITIVDATQETTRNISFSNSSLFQYPLLDGTNQIFEIVSLNEENLVLKNILNDEIISYNKLK